MQPFDYQPRTRVVFAPGSIDRVGECATRCGGARALVVSDPGIVAAGHTQQTIASLQAAGLGTVLFDQVEENPTTAHVDAGVRFAREHQVDLIVGVGGGSSMDCAKGINFLLTNGGHMADYWDVNKATRPMLPLIAVPTTAGTGSEAQSFALISNPNTHQKMACGDVKAAARVAILDPELTVSQPSQVTAVTGIDAMAHAIESHVSTRYNPLSQMFSRAAWRLLNASFERVLQQPDDLEARAGMLLGAHYAGTAIENSMLGATHACANPLTARFGITHGVAIGILLPHVIRYNETVVGERYTALASEIGCFRGDQSAAAVLARRVEQLVQCAAQPSRLAQLDVEQSMLATLAEEAAKQWTAQFNPRPVSAEDVLKLYEQAW